MRWEKRGADIPYDPDSPLYRICPQCSDDFMAETEQDVYCCTKCKDDFNNAKKATNKLVTSECKARNNKLAVEFQLKAAILTSY
jgi:ribosomal protein L37AE/L43A